MGILQNFTDKIFMTIGKPEKVFPVKVEKHRVVNDSKGEPTLKLEGLDRGRTLVDENGNKKFELLNERRAEGLVKYEDFNQDLGSEKYVSIAVTDRDTIVPLERSYNYVKNIEENEKNVNALEYALVTNRLKEWAISDYEQSAKIVETDNKEWWEQPKLQAAMLFAGAGLFFIFLGYAAGEVLIPDLLEALQENTEATRELLNELQGEL